MAITTLSSREFDKHVGRARKAAKSGPVFITDRGKPAYVLLTINDYEQLNAERSSTAADRSLADKSTESGRSKMSIVDLLGMPPDIEDVELEIPRDRSTPRPVDFD